MIEAVRDLFRYDSWADAEHWRSIEAHPAAQEDRQIREKLHHIHQVQRGYIKILKGEPIDLAKKQEPFPSLHDLQSSVRFCHGEAKAFLEHLTATELDQVVTIPWFGAFHPTKAEAMLQLVMHGQYHRGQNATRLR
jgi:uncharacterized damage-inducible protein DinB